MECCKLAPGREVTRRHRRARNLIWLTPESLHAAEHLSAITGVPIPDLIELILLELMEQQALAGAHARAGPRPPVSPTAHRRRRTATVIPIERARERRGSAEPSDLAALRRRCSIQRARAATRLGSLRARERAAALLRGPRDDASS